MSSPSVTVTINSCKQSQEVVRSFFAGKGPDYSEPQLNIIQFRYDNEHNSLHMYKYIPISRLHNSDFGSLQLILYIKYAVFFAILGKGDVSSS